MDAHRQLPELSELNDNSPDGSSNDPSAQENLKRPTRSGARSRLENATPVGRSGPAAFGFRTAIRSRRRFFAVEVGVAGALNEPRVI